MKHLLLTCAGLAFALSAGCSSESASTASPQGGHASVGGSSAGGASASSGGQSSSTNFTAATGGTTGTVSTGGQTTSATTLIAVGGSSTGGANSSGGTSVITGGTRAATGGVSAFTSPTGGTRATGGSSSNNPATGGAPAGGTGGTAGSTATGGKTSAASSAGGTATATGGVSATGGSSTNAGTSSTGPQHWVGTWTASPYADSNSNNTPPIALTNSVIRQVTHISLGGSQVRVQFSNLRGNGSLTINAAHIALCKAAPAVDSTIDTATDKALTFAGKANMTVAQGQEVWSDPIDFDAPNQANITITTSLGTVPNTLTQHSGSRTTSYFKSGGTASDLNAANMSSASSKALWFFISGIDVMADADARGVVAVGDSITDGRGSDTDKNNRWTDILAARLQGNAATAKVSMMNQAIGATNLAGTDNTTAQSRFNRDVLGMSGVKYVIIFEGVNDIGSSGSSSTTLKNAYTDLISRAHNKGLLIYGGTILPFGGNTGGYDTTAHESVRQEVNTYIRSGVFDGVIDFDAALKDPAKPTKLLPTYAQWSQEDWLHPGPAGYQKMGETPDLSLFTK